ncbi:vWA domain-containing protein [Rhodococcus spongiicola]|uniref:VWA domain-containing protein n=1 Tax=Rhodococcus spongiicola TaxID=2487352 RepID=A0A438AYA4_9NOCA|nr:VWA domain-containing protein [Rhodococcus spongiicola]RVW03662.1 VWA domain-containing protein [Rhodococcus spongiicola]
MPNLELTHLVFLLDRSGSMQIIKSDVEGGFAAFIDEQRAVTGECTVTLAQFDTKYEVVYRDVPLEDVPALDLQPRSSTALLDAMGKLITDISAEHSALSEEERPGAVIVAIMTDGLENASRTWTRPAIKKLVELHTNQYDWQFLYMGADQDAIEVGTDLGVKREQSLTYSKGKSRDAMSAASANIRSYRDAKQISPSAPMPAFSPQQRVDAED